MTYAYECKRCGAFWMREEEEPILSFSFYNPHRFIAIIEGDAA